MNKCSLCQIAHGKLLPSALSWYNKQCTFPTFGDSMNVLPGRSPKLMAIRIALVVVAFIVAIIFGCFFATGTDPVRNGVKAGCIVAMLLGSFIGIGGMVHVGLSPKRHTCPGCPAPTHIHHEPGEGREMGKAIATGSIVFLPALLCLLFYAL